MGVDYKIEIKKDANNKEYPIPFGPLYNIIRKEFLVLKKILKDLLDKIFIRISNLEAGALILSIRELGGGLRFYYNYRTFNIII